MMAKLFPRPRGSRIDWVGMREFKLTLKVSKAAILYRAHQLDLLTDDQYKSGVITLRRTGEATGEREDHLIADERPELLLSAFKELAEKKAIFAEDVASSQHIFPQLLFNLIGFKAYCRDSTFDSARSTRPPLCVVR